MNKEELILQVENYCKLLEDQKKKEYPDCIYNQNKYTYKINKTNIKVIQCNYKGVEESAFCFIDFDGNLYKTAGWNKAAKGIRGHISKPENNLTLGSFYRC